MPAVTSFSFAFLVPYSEDPLTHLSQQIIQRATLPDLSRVVVLVPELTAASRLRRCLLEQAERQGCSALLGPHINTLRGWIERHSPGEQRVLSNQARELLLVESLLEYPGLFGANNPWQLATSLLKLFDAMTLHRITLTKDLEQFTAELARAYGMRGIPLSGLGREARMIHTLWESWHAQLQAEDVFDAHGAYLLKLSASLKDMSPAKQFYLAGFHTLLPGELAWSKFLYKQDQLTFIGNGQLETQIDARDYHPDAPLKALLNEFEISINTTTSEDKFTQFINSLYAPRSAPLTQRAKSFAEACPASPAIGRLRVFEAGGAEQEAIAIDVQVRSWLLEGRRHIGIVTEDRRLARRVRALLDRASVVLQDAAGWALSTTSAATVLERWLQVVEEDFAQVPLLDLLKSPFIFPDRERDSHLATVYRLEHDIILHENIGRGLTRYRQHLNYRQKRLPDTFARTGRAVRILLDELEHAALPLLSLTKGGRHRPETLLNALQESLQRLGITTALAPDAAGGQVLQELEAMRCALPGRKLRMTWVEFRTWLGHTLECANFCPATRGASVQLLTLAQTPLCRFDALVIAGVDREHLPGAPEPSPFFNSAVTQELGLPTSHDTVVVRFHHFRRLLECAPQVLLTVRREQDGEAIIASPWLQSLQAFHGLAYGDRLVDATFAALIREPATQVFRCDTPALPLSQPNPRPRLEPALAPRSLSVSAHQQMIDCPYQFFVSRCLALTPIEPIREALEKADYGQRVHRALEAFHIGTSGLPGPFNALFKAETRQDAIALLTRISQTVFAQDLEDNFLHRGWLKRWLAVVPDYINWQMQRAPEWIVTACEVEACNSDFIPTLNLRGRLDRIDFNSGGGLAVIDYKTGATASQQQIESGEAIQLSLYALLAEGLSMQAEPRIIGGDSAMGKPALTAVERVEYLVVDKDKVKTGAQLEGTALIALKEAVGERLKTLVHALNSGEPLPAWGDKKACLYCKMQGLCRKQAWSATPDG